MALQLYVNGVEKTSIIQWDSLQLTENLTDEIDTLSFQCSKFGSRTFSPVILDEVTLYQDSVKVFGGNIVDINEVSGAADHIIYQVTVKDYSHVMDRFLVVESYENKPVINIICDILNKYINKNDRVEIAMFETNEIWSAGSASTSTYRVGDQGRLLTSSGSTTTAYRDVTLNLQPTGFATSDYIDLDVNVDAPANISSVVIKLGNAAMTAYYSKDITSSLTTTGWNLVHLVKSGFSTTGSPSWSSIARIQIEVTALASTTVNVVFDNWQMVKSSAFTRNGAQGALQSVSYIAFNYSQPSKALQRLAELFQWHWYVDQDKDIHFFAKLTELSPFNLSDTAGNHIYNSLVLRKSADQLRNSIYVRGGDYLASSITDNLSHQADGSNKFFKMGYKYQNYSLTQNSVAKAVGVENLESFTANVSAKQTTSGVANLSIGDAAARTRQSQQIIVTSNNARRNSVKIRVKKVGAPVDNLQVQLFSDSGSNTPSASSISTAGTVAGGTLTTSYVETTFSFTGSTVMSSGTKYHVVVTRSGANDASNYYQIDAGNLGDYDGVSNAYNGATWSANSNKFYFIELLDYEALYNFNEKLLTFQTAPAGSDVIVWTGQPYLPVIVQFKDNTSIATYGEYQHKIIDKTIKSTSGAQQRAQQDLLEWAAQVTEGYFVTYTAGLHAGQTINIQSTIRGIDEDYLIKSIRASARGPNQTGATDHIEYKVDVVSTKTMTLLYWLQAQATKDEKEVVISEDELLNKIESIYESVSVSEVYSSDLCTERVWSNDAGTTTSKLIWDGVSCDRWN